jgi:hypothetical protein
VSIQEGVMLQELARLVRDLAGRVKALEQRSPSWDPWPADILERLERLERTAGQPIESKAPADPVAANADDSKTQSKHDPHANREARRVYMREYMRRRRAARLLRGDESASIPLRLSATYD